MKADEISSLCYFQFVGAGSLAYAYKLCTLYITITDVYQYFEHVSYLCFIFKKKSLMLIVVSSYAFSNLDDVR